MEENMVSVWYRKGATQDITFEEFMTLLRYCCPDGIIDRDKYNYSDKTVDEILDKFDSDGDGYIPSEVIEDLANDYGVKINSEKWKCDGIAVGW